MKGLAAESLLSYQRAVALNPQMLQPHLHLAVCHIQENRQEEAIKECQCALRIQPNSVEARRFLASALIKLGQTEEAIANLLAAQALEPQHGKIAIELTQAYLIAGNPSAALSAATQGLAMKKGTTALLTYQYYALWELGMDEAAQTILDLHRLIFEETLAPPDEYSSLAAFHADFKAELMAHPTLTWEPSGKTTRHGYQSGPLDEISLPLTDLFIGHLRRNLDVILAKLPDEPHHPFLGNKPADYRLHAWATLLEPGGHQEPHFHASGWLSGVYYLEVPPEIALGSEEGWIELGRHPQMIPMRREPPVRTMKPEVGKLILFPSYTYHRTLPFGGTGKRISIAFDVMPADQTANAMFPTAQGRLKCVRCLRNKRNSSIERNRRERTGTERDSSRKRLAPARPI